MCPERIKLIRRQSYSGFAQQKGLGLPVALFIIVVMALIAVAVNNLNQSSSQSFAQNVLSTRAFYAAESGAQLRLNAVIAASPCSCGVSSGVNYTFNANILGLSGCVASTQCSAFTAATDTYCTIVSTGTCNGTNASRQIEVRAK